MDSAKVINFYKVKDDWGCFSNFYEAPIELDGKIWPTSEHYFQAQKFAGTSHEEEIRLMTEPQKAADAGRERHRPLRKDWEQVKDDIMRKAVYAKFTQHPDLKAELLRTGQATIVEHTKNDRYWGDGGDGTGRNMLGVILTETRGLITSEKI